MTGRHPRLHTRVDLAGIVVDLMDEQSAVHTITERAGQPALADRPVGTEDRYAPPLSVVSANLDHIVQFGQDGRWRRTLGDSLCPTLTEDRGTTRRLDWLTLLDGAPLVAQANRLTGREWPRLAGSDLIGPLLDAADEAGITVGFLGGSYLVQRLLSRQLVRTRPGLVVAGMWSPDRSDLADEEKSLHLAESIADAGVQLLIVGLGKPRQELWISRYGPATGANVLLAFGAVVDFLADAIQRAPRLASDHGLEWAWRLAREPRRLAKRYLLDDPPGLVQMRRNSALLPPDGTDAADLDPVRTASSLVPRVPPETTGFPRQAGSFVSPGRHAEVAVITVTYNSEADIERFISSLRREAGEVRLRVIVADNDSSDRTVELLSAHPDVVVVPTGGNLGYAAGINRGQGAVGDAEAILVLNPDLEVRPGAISRLLAEIRSGAADLVVPRLVDGEGVTQFSLRREPRISRAFGDAMFGSTWTQRPPQLAEIDAAPESYQFGHEIEWATGAALMIGIGTAVRLGDWDERFFLYSEETDYFRRARDLGATIWYEPSAVMMHSGSGSGSSARLNALMAVNRVRYIRKHHPEPVASMFRTQVILHEALRAHRDDRRGILGTVSDEARWDELPGPTATPYPANVLTDFPRGSVIIPAHNEAAVIQRTLTSLDPVLRTGRVEVIVVCNGCTDETAELAAAVPGVQVLDCPVPSKTAAMNAGDAVATQWPRVYLDADTEISPTALRKVLERLHGHVLAARPEFRYDVSGATWPVRAYYRARRRLPSTRQALWGAGVFALTEEGHARFGEFPDVTADDYFVDQVFSAEQKMVVPAPPVQVRTPKDVRSLMKILRRNTRGPAELREKSARSAVAPRLGHQGVGPVDGADDGDHLPAATLASTASSTAWELFRSVRGPLSVVDALSYTGLAAAPRFYRGRGTETRPLWERDDSSRMHDYAEGPRP
ncbi:WecB/TagA/CpsF family glycosyltransferase [Citricoccus sp. NPDC079358]|uniref:WecB/TagA/CpsF family glycosyltransferase n=1 Tax=Citricoccus sp. NPDC079358 TaxID=3154653 RepID=UPI00344F0C82